MDSALLAQMVEDISTKETRIHSVLIIRNGTMVTEAYFQPYTRDTKIEIQSVTKSVIGMLVGRALANGQLRSVDETLVSFFPGRVFPNPSHEKFSITLSHLLSMSSGFDCEEFRLSGPTMEASQNWVAFMLDLPMLAAPGKQFGYCNGNPHLLSVILEKETGMNTRLYANQELFAPLGIPAVELEDWPNDPKGFTMGGYGLRIRPVDMAKLGYFYLQNGKWEDQQLVPDDWVAKSTVGYVGKGDGSSYGYLWTVYPGQPHYSALGMGGQQIHVYPDQNLVVVMTSALEDFAESPEINRLLREYILPAVISDDVLVENRESLVDLQTAIEFAAYPARDVAVLPTMAEMVSGKTYTFDENPVGWKEGVFEFTSGADTAALKLNGSEALIIGMDHVFRRSNVEAFGELYLRGSWTDEQTFLVDYPYPFVSQPRLGDLGDTDIQFRFEGNQVEVNIIPQVFGGSTINFFGKR
jgi:CubicO group peptidase (beta-lactamase class C family)